MLSLVLVLALFLIALFLHRLPEMVLGFTGMVVFIFQGALQQTENKAC